MPSVLFVDDEKYILDSIKRSLRQMSEGWEFFYANSGEEAKEILDGPCHIDAVVTDVMMPGLNGYELVQYILDKHPETTPMVLSGHCKEADQLEFERMNVPFFQKPFPVEELTSTISMVLLGE